MSTTTTHRATIADLYAEPKKAELVGGRIIKFMPTGFRPGEIASNIYVALREYQKRFGGGWAANDNLGFVVPELPSGRESFCPDASYVVGPKPRNPMRFVEGPPTFAVEVRSEGDTGPAAEAEMAAKRADYFEAGTRVVWDVDPIARTIAAYRADAPEAPQVFGAGDTADAEPAVPDWRMGVNRVFEDV